MLRKLRPFNLEKKRLRGDLIATFQYLTGLKRKPDSDSDRNCSDSTKSNWCKLKEGEFRLAIRKNLFTGRYWHRLPSDFFLTPGSVQSQAE